MMTVRISHFLGIGVEPFVGRGRGKTLEAAALNAYKHAGFLGGVAARIVNDAGNGRYGVRFVFRARPHTSHTLLSSVWDLRVE